MNDTNTTTIDGSSPAPVVMSTTAERDSADLLTYDAPGFRRRGYLVTMPNGKRECFTIEHWARQAGKAVSGTFDCSDPKRFLFYPDGE